MKIKGSQIADKNILFDLVGMNIAIQIKAFYSTDIRISGLISSLEIVLIIGDERHID